MATLLHETGKIVETSEGRLFNHAIRHYPYVRMERADGTRVEINDVIVDDTVFSRFEIGKPCTILFFNRITVVADHKGETFSNEIVGYGDQDDMAWPKYYPTANLEKLWGVVFVWAVTALYVFFNVRDFSPGLVIFVFCSMIAFVPFVFHAALLTYRVSKGNQIRDKLKRLGFTKSKSVIYG